jgi:hypothetical protein
MQKLTSALIRLLWALYSEPLSSVRPFQNLSQFRPPHAHSIMTVTAILCGRSCFNQRRHLHNSGTFHRLLAPSQMAQQRKRKTNTISHGAFPYSPMHIGTPTDRPPYRARGFCRFVRLQSTHFRH